MSKRHLAEEVPDIQEVGAEDTNDIDYGKARIKNRASGEIVHEKSYTLEEVADMFGCTRERIRQIQARALQKVRARLRAKGLDLKDFLPD